MFVAEPDEFLSLITLAVKLGKNKEREKFVEYMDTALVGAKQIFTSPDPDKEALKVLRSNDKDAKRGFDMYWYLHTKNPELGEYLCGLNSFREADNEEITDILNSNVRCPTCGRKSEIDFNNLTSDSKRAK